MIKCNPIIFLIALLYPWLANPVSATGTIEPYEGSLKQPGITLQDLDHRAHTLADYRGKVVLVNFWASWCVPCITEMPGMQRLADTLTDQPFEILAVNVSDTEDRIREFLRRMNLRLTILVDHNGDTFKAWQGKVLPASFLLDRSGRIRYRVIGPLEWDSEEVGKIIEALLQHP
ncbi:MAG: TlpA disulfide reductase family protein [Pseudomonadota bacterium]